MEGRAQLENLLDTLQSNPLARSGVAKGGQLLWPLVLALSQSLEIYSATLPGVTKAIERNEDGDLITFWFPEKEAPAPLQFDVLLGDTLTIWVKDRQVGDFQIHLALKPEGQHNFQLCFHMTEEPTEKSGLLWQDYVKFQLAEQWWPVREDLVHLCLVRILARVTGQPSLHQFVDRHRDFEPQNRKERFLYDYTFDLRHRS